MQVILLFWLVLAYDLLEDRRIADDSARFKLFWIWANHNSLLSIATNQLASFCIFVSAIVVSVKVAKFEIKRHISYKLYLWYKTNSLKKSDTFGCASCATFLILPHFDVLCDLLLNRLTATWNLFVKCTQPTSAVILFLAKSDKIRTPLWLNSDLAFSLVSIF